MKKTLAFLLSVILIFSCTACSSQKDPVLSLVSKMENASFEKDFVDFSKETASVLGASMEDFDLTSYEELTDEETDSVRYFRTESTLFSKNLTIMLTFNKSQNILASLTLIPGELLSEAEVTSIDAALPANFTTHEASDRWFYITDDILCNFSSYEDRTQTGFNFLLGYYLQDLGTE